jgi:hypothetical protein
MDRLLREYDFLGDFLITIFNSVEEENKSISLDKDNWVVRRAFADGQATLARKLKLLFKEIE